MSSRFLLLVKQRCLACAAIALLVPSPCDSFVPARPFVSYMRRNGETLVTCDSTSQLKRGTRNVPCMQSDDDELQIAVRTLAAQVEDLTATVRDITASSIDPPAVAGDEAPGVSSPQTLNGAAVDTGATSSISVAPADHKELVSTTAARQRIAQWLREQGEEDASLLSPPSESPSNSKIASSHAVAPTQTTEAPAATPPVEKAPTGNGHKVKIEWEGAIHEVTCDAETTVLEAAMDAGLELPHSCMSGSCLTCPAKLVSGNVDQGEGVLEDDQTEAGYMLTCVSYPLSDLHFKVIDEDDLP